MENEVLMIEQEMQNPNNWKLNEEYHSMDTLKVGEKPNDKKSEE